MKKEYNLTELGSVARELLNKSTSKTILFFGAMGVGKTTLIKELCKELGIQDVANSPTFSLVNEYKSATNDLVYHFDFYRIEDETEAYDMGIEEYFYSNAWCFVEWPEHIENLLPLDAAEVHIEMLENGLRSIQLKNKA